MFSFLRKSILPCARLSSVKARGEFYFESDLVEIQIAFHAHDSLAGQVIKDLEEIEAEHRSPPEMLHRRVPMLRASSTMLRISANVNSSSFSGVFGAFQDQQWRQVLLQR
jgi:hypothetical protein